jgi:hypothetical protein
MIMFLELVRTFELGTVITKLMLGDQVAVEQQFDRIIQGGTAHPVFVVLHPDVKGLDVEMPVGIIDFL